MTKVSYSKSYTNYSDLVSLLQSRGLLIEDAAKAEQYIKSIGYFRLSAYFHPLIEVPKDQDKYKAGATFKNALNIYRFDRKLRLLVFNEIEKIEVAIRSIIVNTSCKHFSDVFWITDSNNFKNEFFFTKSLSEINAELERSKDDFIAHFRDTYNNPHPPSWMIAEIMPLGNICRIYKNLRDLSLKRDIAIEFGLQPIAFESWIMTIAGLRNICCHHGRLWNRTLKIKTSLPKKTTYNWLVDQSVVDIQRIYFRLCLIKYLLYTISPNNTFKEKILELIDKYPTVDVLAMGFTPDWENEPLWQK